MSRQTPSSVIDGPGREVLGYDRDPVPEASREHHDRRPKQNDPSSGSSTGHRVVFGGE